MAINWTWTYTPPLLFQNVADLRSQPIAQAETWPLWSKRYPRAIFAA